ncbi:MAG: restriction endonuclease subunit S [Candidatus Riflebacteria bacterium]|nr:restriction endonuclease subunit S [Candidatus Riflebacteria bacterium]
MKQFTTSINELQFGSRLVPSFYYYAKILKDENVKKGIEYIKLGDYSIISDGEHSAIPRNNISGIRYLYGRNIKEGVIDFDPISDDSYIYQYDYDNFKRCHIKENDVLIAIYGTVGKSAVYKSSYVGVAGIPRHIANITLKASAPITPEYLSAFFRTKYGKWQMNSLMTGNIQQLLSLKNLRAFDVPVLLEAKVKEVTEREKEALKCEIKAQQLLSEAKQIFYDGLGFEVKTVKRNFTFSVLSKEMFENNIWSTSFYDKLYVKMSDVIAKYNSVATLGTVAALKHGNEVGSDNYKSFSEKKTNDKAFIRTSDIVNNELDLYPDYYVDEEVYQDIKQDIKPTDVVFTKDGKIGCVAMITEADNVIISSGLERLRLNAKGKKLGLTQEYLFLALSIPEVGRYAAIRRTVIASTIPHLREERLKEIEIPIEDKTHIEKISKLVEDAFNLRIQRKKLIQEQDVKFQTYLEGW